MLSQISPASCLRIYRNKRWCFQPEQANDQEANRIAKEFRPLIEHRPRHVRGGHVFQLRYVYRENHQGDRKRKDAVAQRDQTLMACLAFNRRPCLTGHTEATAYWGSRRRTLGAVQKSRSRSTLPDRHVGVRSFVPGMLRTQHFVQTGQQRQAEGQTAQGRQLRFKEQEDLDKENGHQY
jgi:hypothetical protein